MVLIGRRTHRQIDECAQGRPVADAAQDFDVGTQETGKFFALHFLQDRRHGRRIVDREELLPSLLRFVGCAVDVIGFEPGEARIPIALTELRAGRLKRRVAFSGGASSVTHGEGPPSELRRLTASWLAEFTSEGV